MVPERDPLVRIRNLSYSYSSSIIRKNKPALSGVNLNIFEGEKVAVTGPSGSGKSTLILSLTGLIPHCRKGRMSGSISVGGMDTKKTPVAGISSVCGFVFQDPDHQMIRNDVDSEIAFGLEQAGYQSPEIERKISEITGMMNIGHLRGREISEISWGERQKVAIASVLVLKPKLLLLDEPLSGLDTESAISLLRILDSANRSDNISIIIVEHRLDYLCSFAHRMIMLDSGRIIRDTSASSFFSGITLPGRTDETPYHGNMSVSGMETDLLPFSSKKGEQLSGPPSVIIEDLTFIYPGKDKPVLEGITAEFYPGEAVAISGPNGSGKSTLAKHFNGLLRPERGRVIISGKDISGKTVAETAVNVALLSQHADYQLFAETIEEELAFGPENIGIDHKDARTLTSGIIDILDLRHLGLNTHPLKLSVGERQRVAIAGYLAMDTPVIIMDEPTLGLDTLLKQNLSRAVNMLKESGKTLVIFTHDREFAASFADRQFFIDQGHLYPL